MVGTSQGRRELHDSQTPDEDRAWCQNVVVVDRMPGIEHILRRSNHRAQFSIVSHDFTRNHVPCDPLTFVEIVNLRGMSVDSTAHRVKPHFHFAPVLPTIKNDAQHHRCRSQRGDCQRLSRRLLVTTETLLAAIAAAANIGGNMSPSQAEKTPAAKGIPIAL